METDEKVRENQIADLRDFLSPMPQGPIAVEHGVELERRVQKVWTYLRGSEDGGMAADKLRGRVENPCWNPPELVFKIERHGATVLGSSRAELQTWCLNLDNLTARCADSGRYRQVRPRNPSLKVRPLAEEIARMVLSGTEDSRLQWQDDRNVRILTGQFLGDAGTPKQTIGGWRKRFHQALSELLQPQGWQRSGGWYRRVD